MEQQIISSVVADDAAIADSSAEDKADADHVPDDMLDDVLVSTIYYMSLDLVAALFIG